MATIYSAGMLRVTATITAKPMRRVAVARTGFTLQVSSLRQFPASGTRLAASGEQQDMPSAAADRPHYIDSDTEDTVSPYDSDAGPAIHPLLLCPKVLLKRVDTTSLNGIVEALREETHTLAVLAADHWTADRRSSPDIVTLWPSTASTWRVVEGVSL
jgi:hypothetical protein